MSAELELTRAERDSACHRLAEARALLEALCDIDPNHIDDGYLFCFACAGNEAPDGFKHAEECPWDRARRWLEANRG